MTANPIELHVDLHVEPGKEKDLVDTFHTAFQPAISRQAGFVSVALLKARASPSYRLVISFRTEEHRLAWAASADHHRVWPKMEKDLTGEKFTSVLFDKL